MGSLDGRLTGPPGGLVPFDRDLWRRFAAPVDPVVLHELPASVTRDEVAEVFAPLAGLVAERAAARRAPGPFVVGVTGGVAAGKSTAAAALHALLAGPPHRLAAAVVSTDGFLLPEGELDARGLAARKGFPETYDADAVRAFATDLRAGRPARAPVYSHRTYDVVAGSEVVVDGAAVVVLEGLVALQDGPDGGPGLAAAVDLGVYVHAPDDLLVEWFVARIQELRRDALGDPDAFFHALAPLSVPETEAMARRLWDAVNGPNLRRHVAPTVERADVVLVKGAGHRVDQVLVRLGRRARQPPPRTG